MSDNPADAIAAAVDAHRQLHEAVSEAGAQIAQERAAVAPMAERAVLADDDTTYDLP